MTKAYETWHHAALRNRWSAGALSRSSGHVSPPHSAAAESPVRSWRSSQEISTRLPRVQLHRHFAIQAIPISFTQMKKKRVSVAQIPFSSVPPDDAAWIRHLVSFACSLSSVTVPQYDHNTAFVFILPRRRALGGSLNLVWKHTPLCPWEHHATKWKKWRPPSPLVTDEKQTASGPSATQLDPPCGTPSQS